MPTITIALADGLKPKTLALWIIEIGRCRDLENNKNGQKIKGFLERNYEAFKKNGELIYFFKKKYKSIRNLIYLKILMFLA